MTLLVIIGKYKYQQETFSTQTHNYGGWVEVWGLGFITPPLPSISVLKLCGQVGVGS